MKSSSLPIITSTSGARPRLTSRARVLAADRLPQRGPVVEVVGDDRRRAAARPAIASAATIGRRLARERAKMPPVWNQRAPSSAEDLVPVDVARPQLATPRCGRGRSSPTAPRTPKPRSVKLSPLRTARPTPSYGTQRDVAQVDAALQHEVLDQAADGVVGERGHDRRAQAEAAPQAAGDVVLAAALPGPERAGGAMRPSPGSRRSMTSPSATRSQRHSSGGRSSSCRDGAGILTTAAPQDARPPRGRPPRRPRPLIAAKSPAAIVCFFTIQLPPQATTCGWARYAARLSALIPPVGTKRTPPKGAAIALR